MAMRDVIKWLVLNDSSLSVFDLNQRQNLFFFLLRCIYLILWLKFDFFCRYVGIVLLALALNLYPEN